MDLENTLRTLAPGLVRFCIGILGHADEGEDLAQESLAALVRFWKSNGPPDSPAAFVYLVARRQAGRFRRRWKRFLPLPSLDAQADCAVNPERGAIESQRISQALGLLNRLPRRQRQALLIALDNDIRVTDAARALGISVSAFKMRVCRARRCLRQWLEENHEKEGTRGDRPGNGARNGR